MGIRRVSDITTRLDNTTTYAAGDVVGTILEFPDADRPFLRGGEIRSAVCIDSSNVATKPDLELMLFSATISDLDADNVAFSPTDAQTLTFVGSFMFATASFKATDASAVCTTANIGIAFDCQKLWGVLIARNAYEPIALETFTVVLNILEHHDD
jgi:hypothetical protein